MTNSRTALLSIAFATLIGGSTQCQALSFGLFGSWDSQARRDAAQASMQAVVDRFNVYGDFDWGSDGYVDVYYNAGVPTAQASYYGSIDFGGTWPNERVTQHELNHWLGTGTFGGWYNQFSGGAWTGPKVSALMQQFDGEGAALRQSGVHFYPYGLNFDSEVPNDSIYMRNVALTYAMRQDMGNGNPADPWSGRRITLTGCDPVGTSAFNWFGGGYSGSYPGWSDLHFAHAGGSYSTGDYLIRTPLDTYNPGAPTPSFTFAGDVLTINNTNGAAGGLVYNGKGTSGVVTIPNLQLSDGYVRHGSGSTDLFRLDGAITLSGTSTIDAAQGDIVVQAPIGGAGGLNVTSPGRTVTFASSNNTYAGATNVIGATLDLQGATGYGTTTLSSGARLLAMGAVRGALDVQPTSTVRVGRAGLSQVLPGGRVLVDDFETYPVGGIGATPNSTGDAWLGVSNGTANAEIVAETGNQALSVRGLNAASDTWRGAVSDLSSGRAGDASLENGATGTYFFRVKRTTRSTIDAIFGLSDQSAATTTAPGDDVASPWDEYAVQLSIAGGQSTSTLRAYSDGAGDVVVTPVSNAQWLNVWLVVDNDAKTFRVATSSGEDDGVDSGQNFLFGRRTGATVGASSLTTFGIHEALSARAELDDLYFVDGVNLSNPLTQTPSYTGETLAVGGDLTLSSGSTIEIDLAAAASDRIEVVGNAVLDGTIAVTLAPDSPLTPNEDFTVLTAASIENNVLLGGPDGALFGVARSTDSELILTSLTGLSGDFDNNGVVDAADYTVWRDNLGAPTHRLFNATLDGVVGSLQYDAWSANYGAIAAAASMDEATPAPEASAFALASLVLALSTLGRRRNADR
ncbi:hypothetical protein [Botrimarina mediterranea]|uniref:hypothetical protein n=1 Tax=Botrimarina mediterranea TaxID=2528022 RepID=UPI001187ADD9|nr:hypothetical protein K2D_21200 [Planctomycetes bacterium K2D]